MILHIRYFPLLISIFLLSACASDIQEDGPAVKTAKACQRAKESNPDIIKGFKITACTNTGVWMVDEYDDGGQLVKRFDFLNQEYAGPESQGIFMPVGLLGGDAPQKLQTIRQALNDKLLHPPET
ncbi:MAG: hypothetical protein DI586_04160 [Micavibrio aeruginosavorus]|uniref:Lipoprotein n=1 Tax=Micavibrio aeruginosavorus TaxID=349221 RepID=A0A2W5FMR6_9BACT|nr:MAG: hypothetical protein DI586_04160 [Micavibrio aeruginosavorus]